MSTKTQMRQAKMWVKGKGKEEVYGKNGENGNQDNATECGTLPEGCSINKFQQATSKSSRGQVQVYKNNNNKSLPNQFNGKVVFPFMPQLTPRSCLIS